MGVGGRGSVGVALGVGVSVGLGVMEGGGGGGSHSMGVVAGGGGGSQMGGPRRQLALAPPKTMIMVRMAFCASSGSLFQGTMAASIAADKQAVSFQSLRTKGRAINPLEDASLPTPIGYGQQQWLPGSYVEPLP
jgi:hypothetical protein